ncbi:Coronin-7 [Clonorchis sinensis]|uniref:Coronin-7 n=1 Tax=Clonorchis sinensis TaxID=79923 RepID=A0A3R7GBR3_CLOSI|nr:Coronin-7 [Clonorchis sinensis]
MTTEETGINLDETDTNESNRKAEKSKKVVFSENIQSQGMIDFAGITVLVIRLSPDEKYWVAGLRNGTIKLIPTNRSSSGLVQTLHVEEEQFACVDICCIPPQAHFSSEKNKRCVAVYASGTVRIWYYQGATADSRLLATHQEEKITRTEGPEYGPKGKRQYNQLLACSCSFDSQRFVTAGDDYHIRVYDLNENACVRVLSSSFTAERMDGHVMRICAVKYHPRGAYQEDYSHIFISGSWDDTVQVWDDRFVHSLWVYGGPHISGSDALDIEPTSNTILTSSWRHDTTILQVWKFSEKIIPRMRYSVEVGNTRFTTEYDVTEMNEAMNERPIEEVPQSSFEVRSKGYVARWIGAHYIAFGGSEANTLRIMTRNKPKPVAAITELPNGVFSLAYLPTPTEESKNSIQLAIASGSCVYLARI